MAKFKGIKWAQILTLMAAIAASIVSEVASAKQYADGLVSAIAAGDVAFTSGNFTADNVGGALEELFTAVSNASSNAAVSISTSTTSSGMLRSYTFTQGGTTIGTIDLTSTDDEAGHVNCRVNTKRMRQSLGWCLVRMGFRMMFPGRMWKEGYHA